MKLLDTYIVRLFVECIVNVYGFVENLIVELKRYNMSHTVVAASSERTGFTHYVKPNTIKLKRGKKRIRQVSYSTSSSKSRYVIL